MCANNVRLLTVSYLKFMYDSMRQRERYAKNGLLNENRMLLIKKIAEFSKENAEKKGA